MFCAWMAAITSLAVRLKLYNFAGSIQIRMAYSVPRLQGLPSRDHGPDS